MLRITAVSYLNTFPFVYGIKESGFLKDCLLDLQVPSVCARKLTNDEADVALVPVGALPEMGDVSIVTDFCIGATGPVKTVLLLSRIPLEKITRIHLDFDSRTSVELVKVLAREHWKINAEWVKLSEGGTNTAELPESVVAIGDKTFRLRDQYPFVYDLAEAWVQFTGLPFVFAVWVTKKEHEEHIINELNQALEFGINNKANCVSYFKESLPACDNCLEYLEKNISYPFDTEKKRGLELFLRKL